MTSRSYFGEDELKPLVRCAFGNVFIFAGDSKEVSNPPHLTSGWSSAFIPFCAYKTDLNFSKVSPVLEGTDFPICSSFLPTILEGQLCYKIQLNQSSGQGKGNELMLLMDYNEDRSLPVSFEKSNDVKSFFNFGTPLGNVREVAGKVHINTLSSVNVFGGGDFIMTDVKRMTATGDFLKMSLKDKKCEVEFFEDCRTRKLLEKCNCVPWEMPGFQVKPRQTVPVLCIASLGY